MTTTLTPVAIVTGAAQGIGHATALALARDGYRLALTSSSDIQKLDPVLAEIKAIGSDAIAIQLNLRDQKSIAQCISSTLKQLGQINVLVNNAGVALRRAAEDVSESDWDLVIDTNLKGTYFITQAVGKYLIQNKQAGSIINIASLHGVVGTAERSTYGISKAGMMHMTKMLALEWAQHDIRVNAIAPGRVETAARINQFNPDEAYRQSRLSKIPLGRFCTAEHVAAAASYLASEAASIMTGQTLILDGGITCE